MDGIRHFDLKRAMFRAALLSLCVISLALGQQGPAGDENVGDEQVIDAPGSVVYIIPIQGAINNLTVDFIEWGLSQAEQREAAAVVLELDTPGGLVSSMFDANERIREASEEHRIIAWINRDAYSAGAAIALACPEIVVSQNNRFGDAAPIMVGPQGPQSMDEVNRAKITSPILTEFRANAERNGYPEALCEAMVTLTPAIYQIEHQQDREVAYVYADQLEEYGLDPENLNAAEGDWRIVKKVHNEGELFTMRDDQPLEYGFAKAFVDSEDELIQYVGGDAVRVERFEPTWSQAFFGWLTTPAVRGFLMFLVIIGLYMEMQSPGLGMGAVIAVSAGAVMLGAPYMTGLANMMDLLLVLTGLALLAVEVFLLPGVGIAGFLGLCFLFVGILLTFVEAPPDGGVLPSTQQAWDAMQDGILAMAIATAASMVGMYFLTKHFGSIPVLNWMILTDAQPAGEASGSPSPSAAPSASIEIGREGVALGDIRGGGRAEIDGRTVDVVTAGEWIEHGERLRVVAVRGNVVTVEQL